VVRETLIDQQVPAAFEMQLRKKSPASALMNITASEDVIEKENT
jgi:hypothetical protein